MSNYPGWRDYVPPSGNTKLLTGNTELPKPNKYHARTVWLGDERFDSQKEADYYSQLLLQRKAGEVARLVVHPQFEFIVNGVLVGRFTPDFDVTWTNGERQIIDVKGGKATRTEAYSLRKRLFAALYAPLTVTEV